MSKLRKSRPEGRGLYPRTATDQGLERRAEGGKPEFIERVRARQEARKTAEQTPEGKADAARKQHDKAVSAKESAMAWKRSQRKGR
jgi:hypothetical protein